MRPFTVVLFGRAPLVPILLLVPFGLAAQNPPQVPPIHVTTHLVQIGIIVRDKNGPVVGLSKDDFVVLDRGKPQKISVFSAESRESHSANVQLQPLPPNTFSDLPQYEAAKPRSVTIVLLDNLNTLTGSSPQPYETMPYWLEDHALASAKQHLIEFLDQLDPNDRLAIYGLTDSLHVLCDFTCNRAQLLAVVRRYDPTSKTQRETAETGEFHLPNAPPEFDRLIDADEQRLATMNNQNRAQATMAALLAIAAHVSDVPGRKNLLWLTSNLAVSGAAFARVLSRANIVAYPVDARGLLPRSPSISTEGFNPGDAYVRGALGLNNNAAQSDQPIGIDTMQKLAGETGGRAFVNTNDLTGAIRKAVEDSAVTYTLGFYIDSDALDGKFHEVRVKVKQAGLELRYPKGYFALKDTAATQDERQNNFLAALHSPLESSSIPVKINVVRVEKPLPHCLSLSGLIDIHSVRFQQVGSMHKGAVEVATIEQDETGKILRRSASRINFDFMQAKYSAYLKTGFPFHQFVQPQAGVTTLRMVVEDPSTAEVGSLIIPLSRVN
ncbi:MAG TPA: VWA domain-containing protein [Candidatus Solibacter sp.]|nr:VWA domain-containing protein [Candidatus Solibacter sp.]